MANSLKSNKMKEEDISARAEGIRELAIDAIFPGSVVFDDYMEEKLRVWILGYKACLAAQSQRVEGSNAEIKVKCHDCNGTGNTQDFLTQVFGAEEDHCNRCNGTGVEIISNLKVSVERMYTRGELTEHWNFCNAIFLMIKKTNEDSTNYAEREATKFAGECVVNIMDDLANIIDPTITQGSKRTNKKAR
jgi:hypothetical protein